MSGVHAAARHGYSNAADTYERGRPEYPEALLGWLQAALGATAGARVIDLGAGTGKFTRLLMRTGASITAVEPVAAMRATLQTQLPNVETVAGTADSTGLGASYADAIVCAQSFHWFATAAALAEMHRVLKAGGKLGLVWNVRDTSVPWVAEISRLFEPYEAGTPRHHSGEWRRALEQSIAAGIFGRVHETVFEHAHEGLIEDVVVSRFLSVSFIAALPAAERTHVAEKVRSLVETHPDLKGRQRIVVPYRTHAYACERR